MRLPEKEGKRDYKPAWCKGLLCCARVEIGGVADGEWKEPEKRLCRVKDRLSGQCLTVANVWAFLALWDKKQAYYDAKVGVPEIVIHQIHTIMSVFNIYFEKQKAYTAIQRWAGRKSFFSQLPSPTH